MPFPALTNTQKGGRGEVKSGNVEKKINLCSRTTAWIGVQAHARLPKWL